MGKTSKREKKSKKHKHKKSKRKHKKNGKDTQKPTTSHSAKEVANESGFEIPVKLMNTKSHTPITPQEYRERQSQMRRVVDPTTGRVRLIRGEGEVMEEIVSREQHAKINSLATKTDGQIFQEHTIGTVKKPK